MSFVGKVLVVVQLVLSVLFMALAGAVFATHQNWKTKYDAQTLILENKTKDVSSAMAERDSARQSSQKAIDDNKAELGRLAAQELNQTAEIVALKKKNNEDQQELQTQTAIAETKARETAFRIQEAEEQRAANRALQIALDETSAKLRQNESEKFGLQVDHDNLKELYASGLEEVEYLKKVVRNGGLESDYRKALKQAEPAPPVDGLVKVVRSDRTNRPKYVQLSIGSDDGLLKGHVLDVMRSGVDGKDPQYLGKVRIISIDPDSAVGEVIESAKNGIIEVGDNVTTKL